MAGARTGHHADGLAVTPPLPFHTYLFKIASRCNINCTYCYVYNQGDGRWALQPKFMSPETARQAAVRIREHLNSHGKRDCVVVFHGGEPLLGGLDHISALTAVLLEELVDRGISVKVGMQSNAMLFTPEIGEFLRSHGMTVGVSLDGPPEMNDLNRVDHQGRGTSGRIEPRIRLLADEFPDVFGGFLSVINPVSNATEVTDYLMSFDPPSIDYLLPLNNHDKPPLPKTGAEAEKAPYGDWLVEAYDRWVSTSEGCSIRIFRSIMNMWLGGNTLVESLGLLPVDLVVVETNGEIEAVDSLKATFEGATQLGFDIANNDFDEVAVHAGVRARQMGLEGLCSTCQACEIVDVCGGGYIPHRYAEATGFDNPSVYCADLQRIIRHIRDSLVVGLSAMGTGPRD